MGIPGPIGRRGPPGAKVSSPLLLSILFPMFAVFVLDDTLTLSSMFQNKGLRTSA